MSQTTRRLLLFGALLLIPVLLVTLIVTAPRHPIALIRVVDVAGKPVAGAVLFPEGLRTKSGPYVSGWYSWNSAQNGVPNPLVKTDADGNARVPYPRFVFERIETGTLCFSVHHPEFVPDRPERIVATVPPAGSPWKAWLDYFLQRLQRHALIARTDPIVLRKGATLRLAVRTPGPALTNQQFFAQASKVASEDTNFWDRPEPGVLLTHRLSVGLHAVRAIHLDSAGAVWFSDVIPITAVTGQTNEVTMDLKPGVALHGQLDGAVPRPVTRGRVVAHVWPAGSKAQDDPPQWHSWSPVREDGTFDIASLPSGTLEIVALCDGFVSTNGPGQFHLRYPQKHVIGTNDLAVTIGMEPTARLEVTLTDDQGRPLKGAQVMTWPNVRYGEWSATILLGDCYNTADSFRRPEVNAFFRRKNPPDFEGVSDKDGLAVLPNLPADVKEIAVENQQFTLPAVTTPGGQKRRQAAVTLVAGQTNRMSLQLEPTGKTPIRHF